MKKILLGLGAAGATLAMIPLFAAFEAHVVNVTARIENALAVPVKSIDFGTVFPQEQLDKFFDVTLSQSFQDEDRVDDVEYFIRQKPKCWNGDENQPVFGRVTEDGQGNFICVDEGFTQLPLLCPYLSKHEVTDDGRDQENDRGVDAFHGPIANSSWNMTVALATQAFGRLAKSVQDISDNWKIDLKTPCFSRHCAQDWEEYVLGINDTANPDAYVQPIDNEHKLFGCDLWLEVSNISLPGIGCNEQADLMLVLDRSGSIDDAEEATLKSAAHAFVTAVAPSTAGVHMGQSSFATTGSLDQELTDSGALMDAAIDAIVTNGLTNLFEGIDLANTELASVRDRDDGTSPDFMVVVTDGNPNQPTDVATARAAAAAEADAARAAGVEVFVVGVGSDVDQTYLETEIADDASHYFSAADFDSLTAILEGIAQCNE